MLRELHESKLLGRGGAAFPAGRKWEAVARQPNHPHELVCNADESEPGTFKDRVLMEGDPFGVLEAIIVAGVTVGAEHGWIYLRGEYPLARQRLQHAIDECRAFGYLGDDVMGRGVRFDVEIFRGAGAYICGEETAIFNSIEGQRGEPRNKPPFPVDAGLFGHPTLVNNVETLVNVLPILLHGGATYAATGTDGSTGPKLFCLSGKVAVPGVYEVPFGTTLGELLARAGGVAGGRPLQAVLLGGAAGGFVGPGRSRRAAHLRGHPRRRADPRLGRRDGARRHRRPRAVPVAHRRVLPRRVLRSVRAVPRRHRPPGGGPAPSRGRRRTSRGPVVGPSSGSPAATWPCSTTWPG